MKFFIALVLSLAICGFVISQQTPTTAGDWVTIEYNNNNDELRRSLFFGVDESVSMAITAGQIADGVWNCTQVNSLKAQVVAGINYNFDVNLEDGTGDTAHMEFIVFDGLDGSTMELVSYQVLKM